MNCRPGFKPLVSTAKPLRPQHRKASASISINLLALKRFTASLPRSILQVYPTSGLDSVEPPTSDSDSVVQAVSTSSSAPEFSADEHSPSTDLFFQRSTETTATPAINTSCPPTASPNPFTTATLFATKSNKSKVLRPMVDDEIDEGEKDDHGNVLKAADELYEECGGRVV